MSEWRECLVEDIAAKHKHAMSTGPFGSAISSKYFVEDGVPVIRGGNLSPDVGIRIKDDGLVFIHEEKAAEFERSVVKHGDIVFTCWGTINQIGLIDARARFKRYIISNKQMKLSVNPEAADYRFIYYLFSSPDKQTEILNNGIGAAVPGFNLGQLKKMPLSLPSTTEQIAIADVLSSLDDKIDLLQRQNKTLEAMAEVLFRQWFVEEATDDWPITTLAEHFEAFRGLSYKGSGLTGCGLGKPMHNLNSVYEGGGYKEAGIKYYSGDFKDRHMVHAGDVIVANTEQGHEFRLIGFPAIVPKYFGKTGIFSQHIYRVVPKDTTYLTRDFLYRLIMENDVREQIISATNGSTVNMLALDGLQRPSFRLPPEALVRRFDEIASEAREKRELNHNTVRTLEKLRDTLLPKLMSGEVRVDYD